MFDVSTNQGRALENQWQIAPFEYFPMEMGRDIDGFCVWLLKTCKEGRHYLGNSQ
jgi:hypothetical protein